MRGPLLERMPPFEGTRPGGEQNKEAITNGLDTSPDSQNLLNDLSPINNNSNSNIAKENNESVSLQYFSC